MNVYYVLLLHMLFAFKQLQRHLSLSLLLRGDVLGVGEANEGEIFARELRLALEVFHKRLGSSLVELFKVGGVVLTRHGWDEGRRHWETKPL